MGMAGGAGDGTRSDLPKLLHCHSYKCDTGATRGQWGGLVGRAGSGNRSAFVMPYTYARHMFEPKHHVFRPTIVLTTPWIATTFGKELHFMYWGKSTAPNPWASIADRAITSRRKGWKRGRRGPEKCSEVVNRTTVVWVSLRYHWPLRQHFCTGPEINLCNRFGKICYCCS